MQEIILWLKTYFDWFYIPRVTIPDIIDIIVIAYFVYHIMLWFKTSRAWTLLKGIMILVIFIAVAGALQLNTVLWIAKNIVNVLVIAFIILFQPELRRALDELGRKQFISRLFSFDSWKELEDKKLSDRTIYELVKTASELSKAKTGALIVIEHDTPLGEYENTGIKIDAIVTEQLLINIFEKNTPLHDGAVLVRDNRVVAATCYLPLTERNDVNKELGTRHRAGLGISEVTDSMTIIVSEETGQISVAHKGVLYQHLDEDSMRKQLVKLQDKQETIRHKKFKRGGKKNVEEN